MSSVHRAILVFLSGWWRSTIMSRTAGSSDYVLLGRFLRGRA